MVHPFFDLIRVYLCRRKVPPRMLLLIPTISPPLRPVPPLSLYAALFELSARRTPCMLPFPRAYARTCAPECITGGCQLLPLISVPFGTPQWGPDSPPTHRRCWPLSPALVLGEVLPHNGLPWEVST